MRFAFVLHKEKQAFYQSFAQEIAAAVKQVAGIRAALDSAPKRAG